MNPVEVKSLTKIFDVKEGPILHRVTKDVRAVNEVSFNVGAGEVFGLLGPNGAGKTTTVKMLCTLIEPTSGDAYVNGFSVVSDKRSVRESLGVMLTGERTLYWKLTGRENLEYFASLYHLEPSSAKERISRLLEVTGLRDREDTLVENYSTGMRVRLSFAKALLTEAPVMLFDEPTLGLDPQSSRLIRKVISDLKKEGHAIILTTHNMDEADQLSDRIAIIDHGKIITLGNANQLKEKVKVSDIIEVEARNLPGEVTETLRSLGEVLKVVVLPSQDGGETNLLRIHVSKGKEVLPSILELLVKKDVPVTRVSFIEPTLEDVFITLTGRSLRD